MADYPISLLKQTTLHSCFSHLVQDTSRKDNVRTPGFVRKAEVRSPNCLLPVPNPTRNLVRDLALGDVAGVDMARVAA